MKRLVQRRQQLLAKLPPLDEVLRGSLVQRAVRCGKQRCRCARGELHRAVYLSVTHPGGRTEQISLPRDLVATVRNGVAYLGTEASGGADVGQLRELGMPVMDLETDAAPYFDLHHTANDTFDKVDPQLVRLNVAAFAVIAYLAAEAEGGFGRLPVASKPAQ